MTETDWEQLGRTVADSPKWRWLPGMKVLGSFRVVESVVPMMYPVDVPDLRDAATLGCLLALVREAWGDACVCVMPIDYGPGGVMWVCRLTASGRDVTRSVWPTEAQALVAAFLGAPK